MPDLRSLGRLPSAPARRLALALLLAAALQLGGCGSGSESDDEFAGTAEECMSSEPSPIESADPSVLEQLSDTEVDQIYGSGGGLPEEFIATTAVYRAGTEDSPVLITITALDSSEQAHADFRAGFSESLTAQGAEPTKATIAGTESTEFQVPGQDGLGVYAEVGCYSVSLAGASEQEVRAQAENVLGG